MRGGLDGEAHRHRKQLFISLLNDEAVAELVRLSEANLQSAIEKWQRLERVELLLEVQPILARSVCELVCRLVRTNWYGVGMSWPP